MSMSDDSRVSKISYIESMNMMQSWSLCGLGSNILNSRSKEVIYRWRYFSFNISMMYVPVRLLIWSVSYIINIISIFIARDLR